MEGVDAPVISPLMVSKSRRKDAASKLDAVTEAANMSEMKKNVEKPLLAMCPLCGGSIEVKKRVNWFGVWFAILFPPIGAFVLASQGLIGKQDHCVRCPWKRTQ